MVHIYRKPTTICISVEGNTRTAAIMEITNCLLVFLAVTLSLQVLNAEEYNGKEATKSTSNPLENLMLNQNQNGLKSNPLSRVKRQFGPYYGRIYPDYPDYYPVPIILPVGFGGFGYGGGIGGGWFGGRGFSGRGFGGRGFGARGFGARGFGARGFGGRGGIGGGGRGGRG